MTHLQSSKYFLKKVPKVSTFCISFSLGGLGNAEVEAHGSTQQHNQCWTRRSTTKDTMLNTKASSPHSLLI